MTNTSIVRPVEKIPPYDDVLWKAWHFINGVLVVHSWVDMTSRKVRDFEDTDGFISSLFGEKRKSVVMKCPKCKSFGRVNWYRPDRKNLANVVYILVHEPIGGKWGKVTKVLKRRRCYITDVSQRERVLKKVGRYLAPSNESNKS